MNALDLFKRNDGALDHFSATEWPDHQTTLTYMDFSLILALDAFRREFCNVPLTPSPVIAGWYRLDGSKTSQHYAVGRLSLAGDLFPKYDARRVFLLAMTCGLFTGIGFYNDTNGPDGNPQYMIHVDKRTKGGRIVWARDNGDYVYPANGGEQERRFWEVLNNAD